MRNIKVVLEYEGTRYHGWQYQENAQTIQGVVEEALFRLTGERRRVVGAGRTDRGVHARGQVANFFLEKALPLHKIEMGLNAHLPRDVVVKSAEEVPAAFHARFSAKAREYQYFISPRPTALLRHFCWPFFLPFDPSLLKTMAERVVGEHDFGAFARVEVQSNHKRCRVSEAHWRYENGLWIFRIVANRFLHGMVRTLVGTMMDVARGRLSLDDFERIFQSRDRCQAGPAAPARGLILEAVHY
ncbi:MAG: tRNA pseudouridine(38-40) synthase TruA [Calditrichaeota bacterium]|nr:MAG: tRNA pseudouridine(38-40) synthase TruA [Calditrichota bacterium]